MNQRNPNLKLSLIIIVIVLVLTGLYFGNLAIMRADPGGLDFYAHWQGTRAFIYDGIDPYSERAAEQIDSGIRELSPQTSGNYRFVLPLYSLIFLAPVSLVADFTVASAIWMTFLEALVLLNGYMIAGWIRKRRSLWLTLLVMLAMLINYVVWSAIASGSSTIIGFTAIIVTIHFLVKRRDEPAGLLLAVSMVKPDLVLPILLILLIWIIVNRKFTVLAWFLASFALIVGFSMVLIPSWPLNYLASLIEFSARNPVRVDAWQPSALEIRLLIVKNLAIAVAVIFEWFVVKHKGSNRFLWLCGLLMAVLPWVGGQSVQEHTVTIYAAMLIGLGLLYSNLRRGISIGFVLFTFLFAGSGWVFTGGFIPGISTQVQLTWLQFVLPMAVLVILYWSRWWVIRQEKYSEDRFSLG